MTQHTEGAAPAQPQQRGFMPSDLHKIKGEYLLNRFEVAGQALACTNLVDRDAWANAYKRIRRELLCRLEAVDEHV